MAGVRQALKVATVLRGSVRRTSARVRVTAQLIDTESGDYLWSEAYDRQLENVVAIQEEMAHAIVDTLLEDQRIELRNFGVFEVKKRKARKARNPRTGERVDVDRVLRAIRAADALLAD